MPLLIESNYLNFSMNYSDNIELAIRLQDFLESVELLLDNDWYHTKCSISEEVLIHRDGTFLNPFPGQHFTGGKGDNWANRSAFVFTYREIRSFAISEGLYVVEDV